jgi:hypothetical protein
MSTLTIISQALAYDDLGANSNPTQRPIDWKRTIAQIPVENPSTDKFTVAPQASKLVFDGSRSTSIDGTTSFSIAPSPLDGTRYRIAYESVGTAPVFRTARSIPAVGIALTLVVGSNLAVTVTAASGTPFAAAVAGDVAFIPGVTTGDSASPFNSLNEGYWTVLAATGATMTMARAAGEVFNGVSEVVTTSSTAQLQVFSTAGVQVGDTVELVSGFASTALRSYDIVGVNPKWIEVISTLALASQTGILPGSSGLLIYTAAKRWIGIESDQECVVRLNGDTGSFNRVAPWIPGDRAFVGEFKMTGPVWMLEVVNKSSVPANVLVLSAE